MSAASPFAEFRLGAAEDPHAGTAGAPVIATAVPADAPSILIEAADCIGSRAAERGHADGERSMARAVAMFNAWRGSRFVDGEAGAITEREGWVFMALLKLSRAAGGAHRLDDYVDGAAYIALAGECAERHLL